nr:hypothetical protein CFP56_69878 [Quercus suber]
MSTGASTSPPGLHAPLLKSDADHHGSWVAICTAFGVLIIVLTLMIRAYIRVKASPPFSYDDWTLAASTAMAIVQSGVVFELIHKGFGRSIDLIPASNLVEIQKCSRMCLGLGGGAAMRSVPALDTLQHRQVRQLQGRVDHRCHLRHPDRTSPVRYGTPPRVVAPSLSIPQNSRRLGLRPSSAVSVANPGET